MSGVIIDPLSIYWIGFCDSAKTLMTVVAVLTFFAMAGFVIGAFYNAEFMCCDDNKRYYGICKTGVAITVPMFIVTLLAALFIPTSNAVIGMTVAKYATYENVQMTTDGIKEVVDYIVNAIGQIK